MTEIDTPPYPLNTANAAALLADVIKLHDWITEHTDWATETALSLGAPESVCTKLTLKRSSLTFDKFLSLSVPRVFSIWTELRELRESYDEIVRHYETDWSNRYCLYHRCTLIFEAATILNNLFLSFEHLEAKKTTAVTKALRGLINKTLTAGEDDFWFTDEPTVS